MRGRRRRVGGIWTANAISAGGLLTLRWKELWLKEDWWAIWPGLGIVLVALILFAQGSSIAWLTVTPAKWSSFAQLGTHFAANYLRYLAQFAMWLAVFTVALSTLGYKGREFVPSFIALYLLSVVIFAIGQWDKATHNLEAPLVWAGPLAILQASIISILTFVVICWTGVRLGLDRRRLSATLGAGGAVCGVSAAIAIAGAVGPKKDDAPIAITVVITWAVAMIFVLPFVAQALHLHAGVGGAWIGTSEFADAAGFAAAQTYGNLASAGNIAGTSDQAVFAYTLMKVVGRDVWIGIGAFVLALIATTRWERTETDQKPELGQRNS